MNEWAGHLPGTPLSVAGDESQREREAIEREFADRLAECSSLAIRVAYSVLRHQQDAEDVAQDAFTRAHRSFTQLRNRERFRAWLVRLVWRMALDRRRADRRRTSREQVVAPPLINEAGEADAIERERAERLWMAIDALPERLRLVVVLASIEGHGVDDVATMLGIPAGTVKSRLFQARQRLQEALRCLTP